MDDTVVRSAGPADTAHYRAILARTSERDRYFRFFGHVSRDQALRLERLDENLGGRSVAVIAEDAAGMPLGLAHAILEQGNVRAELGIIVASDAQGRGVGTLLLRTLMRDLHGRGCRTLTAQSLDANAAFARMARANGFRVEKRAGGVLTWTIALGAAVASQRRAVA